METRTITEVRLFLLIMNNVHDRAESCTITAVSYDYHKLVDWYNSQKADKPYRSEYDNNMYYKVFKEGSSIEYFNSLFTLELNELSPFGQGIKDEWVNIEQLSSIRSRFLFID